jgi:pyrroline-5-carboxylate reductase
MGTAILQGLLRNNSSDVKSYKLAAYVRTVESVARLRQDLGTNSTRVDIAYGPEGAARVARHANIVLLGCAPGDLGSLLATQGLASALKEQIIVSMLAGVSYEQLAAAFSHVGVTSPLLVRILPTLGAKVGDSVTLLVEVPGVTKETDHVRTVDGVFNSIGTVQYLSESQMTEATAVGALAHALAIVATDTLGDASAAEGLPRSVALSLVQRCLQSATGLMLRGMSPEEMKNAMAIPTGITINSILQLEKNARPAIAESARSAIVYTREMAKKE